MGHNLKSSIVKSSLNRSLALLNARDKKKIGLVVVVQVLLGFLDLVAVALVGILGALSVSGVQSRGPGTRVAQVLEFLHISQFGFQVQAGILGLAAGAMLIIRTACSVFFLRRIYRFLSRRGADISSVLIRSVLKKNLLEIQEHSNQELIYAVTEGVRVITLGIIGTWVTLISDSSLLLVMSIGLFLVDPVIAISTFLIFGFVAVALYKLMSEKVEYLGVATAEGSIKSSELISEVLISYRESFVRNTREFYGNEISKIRRQMSDQSAELAFIPNISKYVIEGIVVLGALLISAIQFYLQDASHAVGTLAIFLAAGTRIAPAVLRLQQSAVGIKGSTGSAQPTLNLIDSAELQAAESFTPIHTDFDHLGFIPKVSIQNIFLKYPKSQSFSLQEINLEISPGETVAIVGKSGAGKTSIVDVLLGVIPPTSGKVMVSDAKPLDAVTKWPGAISYVPQDVALSNTSILANITLGFPEKSINMDQVGTAVELASLNEFIDSLPLGLQTKVGERGAKVSGGQRQRIGIARALYTNPKLIVLDEATSALDGDTEFQISEALRSLKGKVTIVLIAHRLSSVRSADRVVYMEGGFIKSAGTFEQVRNAIPDFDRQAQLMGL